MGSKFSEGKPIVGAIEKIAPERVAEICRQALINMEKQRGYFEDNPIEIGKFAIYRLGTLGVESDLKLLRPLASDKQLSSSVVAAIESIEKGRS